MDSILLRELPPLDDKDAVSLRFFIITVIKRESFLFPSSTIFFCFCPSCKNDLFYSRPATSSQTVDRH